MSQTSSPNLSPTLWPSTWPATHTFSSQHEPVPELEHSTDKWLRTPPMKAFLVTPPLRPSPTPPTIFQTPVAPPYSPITPAQGAQQGPGAIPPLSLGDPLVPVRPTKVTAYQLFRNAFPNKPNAKRAWRRTSKSIRRIYTERAKQHNATAASRV